MLGSCVRDREARADGQGRELIDRIAAGAPIRKLLFVELLGAYVVAIPRVPAGSPRRGGLATFRRKILNSG